jgi:signal recognition particle subunit SRP68
MARTYASIKRYAEAVSLTQTGLLRIREARYQLSLLSSLESTPETRYFPLPEDVISTLEATITRDETATKREWFTYNGGSSSSSTDSALAFKKPLFYDIAFNELEDPLEKIQKRAGRAVTAGKKVQAMSTVSAAAQQQATKAKIDEEPVAPEPAPEPAKASVLGGLLGGWWGRR